jgi:hypothetical protein
MCVIAVCTNDRLRPAEVVAMAAANPHGAGVAWVGRDATRARRVEFLKGLTAADVIDLLPHVPLPQVVHFRFASVGAIGAQLAHPWPIEACPRLATAGQASAVVAHNGTWAAWPLCRDLLRLRGIVPTADDDAEWTDTRAIASLLTLYPLAGVGELLGGAHRLAVLSRKGPIQTVGPFSELRPGLKVSNLWWQPESRVVDWALGPRIGAAAPKGDKVGKDAKIRRYVAAERDVAKLRAQLKQHPELTTSQKFGLELAAAVAERNQLYSRMNGTEIGRAKRALREVS